MEKENFTEKVKETPIVSDLATTRISGNLLSYIPRESAMHYKVVPYAIEEGNLLIGAVKPDDLNVRDALNFIASKEGINYELRKITEEEFQALVSQYSEAAVEINKALSAINEDEINTAEGQGESLEDLIKADAPVVKLVDNLFAEAVRQKASDVHIEPTEKDVIIRYRIDGILNQVYKLQKKLHSSIVARVKILTTLRLDERRRPQDGRFSQKIGENKVDFRVAVFPTSNGEKVILRVLDKGATLLTIEDLGVDERTKTLLLRAIKEPYGIILSTGPTGSGKSTTLYALMQLLDRKSKNVVSLEDPVEYSMEGVNQSEIRPEIGYTFATGLRSILRGDPDIMLIGEIRDKETAQLAFQAALTGHLVFSTVHTNTAIAAITRLIDLGIEPFLLAPTLKLIIGQRLTRKLCKDTGKKIPISKTVKANIEKQMADLPAEYKKNFPKLENFYDIEPSNACPQGTRGRTGVFESLYVSESISAMILEKPVDIELTKIARKEGMRTMYEDAITKGLQGIIPISEVNKIANEDLLFESEEDKITNLNSEIPQGDKGDVNQNNDRV